MAKKPTFMQQIRGDMGLPSKKEDIEDREEEETEETEEEEEETEEEETEETEEEETEETEETEEEEEEEEEEELTRESKKKKGKKTIGAQNRDLREARDKWRKKAEDLEKRVKSLESSTSEDGSRVISALEEKFGSLDESSIERIQGLIDSAEEKDSIKSEFEEYKRRRDITESEHWKDNYETPYNDSIENFNALIANTDPDGEVKNPSEVSAFSSELISEAMKAGSVTATQVKAAINKFADYYENKTGEEYEKPSISEVTSQIRSAIRHREKAKKAYDKWEEESKKISERSRIQEEEKSQKLKLIEKRQRKDMAKKALNGFDVESLEDVFEEDDIVREFNEAHKSSESQIEDPDKSMPYGDVLSLLVKGRLFDQLLEKYKEDEGGKALKRKANRGSRGSDRVKAATKKAKRDPGNPSWLGSRTTSGRRS